MYVSPFSSNYFKLQVLRARDRTSYIYRFLAKHVNEIHIVSYILDYILCPDCNTYYDENTECYCFLFHNTLFSDINNRTMYFYIEQQYIQIIEPMEPILQNGEDDV